LINTSKYVLLKNDKLNPGDKFVISTNDSIYSENLANLLKKDSEGNFILNKNATLALNVVSIEDSGKINYLNSSLRSYEKTINDNTYRYHIIGEQTKPKEQKIDIDSYRNILSSGYNTFKSKISGKLAILAELIMIDSYSVTHRIEKSNKEHTYDIIISTEVGTEETTNKYGIIPELKYYYLSNSKGTLQVGSDVKSIPLESEINLSDIYTGIDEGVINNDNFDL
jgi:hypothetical protein